MNCFNGKLLLLLLGVALLGGWFTPPPTLAIWHNLLDEHFDHDQANENLRWPWLTDLRNQRGWHYNPRDPYRGAEGDERSNYCWALQDFIYNIRVTPQHELHQALWCAVTNLSDINSPRWPEELDYMPNQNAWVWWGPVDLTDAISAGVSFWMYLDLDHFARDSMSAFAVTVDPGSLTDEDFFDNVPIGISYAHAIREDWVQQLFYLDSLVLAGDEENLVSLLGEDEVWIGFTWHSDGAEVAGKGAFIDDVVFSWDDGLFDLTPVSALLGYQVNEDSIQWTDRAPDFEEEIQFKLDFRANGLGETPEFNINLYLDDNLVYSEQMVVVGSPTVIYSVMADTVWAATPDSHVLRWEIDTPVEAGGVVEESSEDNNIVEFPFDVVYNPPPIFEITYPTDNPTPLIDGRELRIDYSVEDVDEDYSFRLVFYWTKDTTGLAENPDIIWEEYGFIGRNLDAERGVGEFFWEAGDYRAELESEDVFWIVGIASDGFLNNRTIAVSPGRYAYSTSADNSEPAIQPLEFGLLRAYPNPFNSTLSLTYNLTSSADLKLSVFDLAGREAEVVQSGVQSPGLHSLTWQPQNLNAGVYIVRLSSGGQTDFKKVIYIP